MNPHQQIVEKKHAKHFFFSWRLNSPILCLCSSLLALSLFYISVWIVSTWASSCRFWICCVGWLIPVQTGGGWGEKKKKKKKKATRSSPRLYSPTSSCLPFRRVLCPSRTILVWLMKPGWFRGTRAAQIEHSILFIPSPSRNNVLGGIYFELISVH